MFKFCQNGPSLGYILFSNQYAKNTYLNLKSFERLFLKMLKLGLVQLANQKARLGLPKSRLGGNSSMCIVTKWFCAVIPSSFLFITPIVVLIFFHTWGFTFKTISCDTFNKISKIFVGFQYCIFTKISLPGSVVQ